MSALGGWKALWVVAGETTVPWGLASAATLRACHPEVSLVWLATAAAARRCRELLPDWLAPNFDIHVCSDGSETDHEASRRLKVQARRLVQGDFIQTDADILFAKPFDRDFSKVAVMAAAANRETVGDGIEDPSNSWSKGVFFATGWNWVDRYFNTGFVVWRDVPEAHEFSRLWENARRDFAERTGRGVDQPAFNKVANDMRCVELLDARYNAPVNFLPKLARGAFCYHYYTGIANKEQLSYMALGWLADKFASRASDTHAAVQSFIRSPEPFRGWGAPSYLYRQSGQWRNYAERRVRVAWDGVKKKLKH